MTWLRKMRPILIVVGLAIGAGVLLGARTLTGGSSSDANAKSAASAPRSNGGPVVLGLIDTNPPPVAYGLPPVLQSGVITKVYVKDGDEVKADQPLYEFDATIPRANVKSAQAGVDVMATKVKAAKELKKQHEDQIVVAKLAAEAAEQKVQLMDSALTLTDKNVEEGLKGQGIPPEKWPEQKKGIATLYRAKVDYTTAVNEQKVAKARLEQLKAADPEVMVTEAEAAVEQANAELAKAQSAVDLCVVKAKLPGTIEQVTIGPGTTLGVGTRTPALWLIPSGPRVVRGGSRSRVRPPRSRRSQGEDRYHLRPLRPQADVQRHRSPHQQYVPPETRQRGELPRWRHARHRSGRRSDRPRPHRQTAAPRRTKGAGQPGTIE